MKRSQPAGPKQALDDTQPATPPTARKSHCEDHNIDCESNTKDIMMDDASDSSVHFWVKQILHFLEKQGQNLLTAICARYKIPYDGTIASIPDGMLEQVAYNAIFNPALPKGDDSLPLMLRDVDGVTGFRLSFLKDRSGIFKSNLVTAKLDGRPFSLECRACSYCGSCFSGRFMELDSTHQRAGGWKEITDKIHAGKYSWKALKGWRLCVPCFTNYGQKGTMDNANRLSIKEVIKCSPADLKEGWCDAPQGKTSPGHTQQRDAAFLSSNRRRADSEPETPRPSKRARSRGGGAGEREAREQYESVEVLADGDWWDAHVIEVAADGARLVHYVGGTADEDEWIARGSSRIRSANAAHDASNAPTPAPSAYYTPQVTPLVTPMKDRDISLPPCGALSLSPQDPALTMPAPLRTPSVSPVLCPSKEPAHAKEMEEADLTLDSESEAEEPRVEGMEDLFSSEEEEEEGEEEEEDFGVSTVVEVLKRPLTFGERTGVVEVSVAATGPDLSYQWFEGDEAIPGAQGRVLKLLNSGELGGRISCRVSNAYGDAWAVCPVLLPSSPEAAEKTCQEAAGLFLLKCRCGEEMEGSPTVLCETECGKCGAVCCGKIQRA